MKIRHVSPRAYRRLFRLCTTVSKPYVNRDEFSAHFRGPHFRDSGRQQGILQTVSDTVIAFYKIMDLRGHTTNSHRMQIYNWADLLYDAKAIFMEDPTVEYEHAVVLQLSDLAVLHLETYPTLVNYPDLPSEILASTRNPVR